MSDLSPRGGGGGEWCVTVRELRDTEGADGHSWEGGAATDRWHKEAPLLSVLAGKRKYDLIIHIC